jgi:hypothetical protein
MKITLVRDIRNRNASSSLSALLFPELSDIYNSIGSVIQGLKGFYQDQAPSGLVKELDNPL